MSIVLIGYRGSGKTTIGRRLADRLWWKFVDTDEMVVKQAGKTIKEIFEAEGEERFRALESAAIGDALKLDEHVIALGGGAVMREENRAALAAGGHKIIYLKADAEALHQRIHSDPETAATRP